MSELRTDFKDDVLDVTQNEKRKYRIIHNDDGTISLEDATVYLQKGDSFGANDLNEMNRMANQMDKAAGEILTMADDIDTLQEDVETLEGDTTTLQSDLEVVKDTLGYTVGKNLLENTVGSASYGGVTCTVNDDSSITLNGTSTGAQAFNININLSLPNGEYILSGCPEGGSESSYSLDIIINNKVSVRDFGQGTTFSIDNTTTVAVRIYVIVGQTYDNVTFYPMIRKASDTNDTYEPYVNDSVDARLDTLESSIRGIDTSNKLYSFTAKGTASNGTNDMSYVAEKDCYAFISYYGASTAKIYLDNLTVFQTNDKVFRNFIIPIKKGQKVRGYASDGVGSYVTCEFYGLL